MRGAQRLVVLRGGNRHETDALLARMSTYPGDLRAGLMNNLIGALIGADVWPRLDTFHVPAAHDAQAARLNWRSANYNLTATNSPTFTANQGYAGDGATSFLDTGAVRNALANYTQDSASLGAWVRNDIASSTAFSVGASTGALTRLAPRTAGNVIQARINDAATINSSTVASSVGYSAINRSGSAARQAYKNGVSVGSDTQASFAISASTLYFLRDATSYSTHQIAAAHIGGSLTAAQHLALYNALATYLTAIGAA